MDPKQSASEYKILIYLFTDNFFEEEIQKEIWKKMMRPKWSYTGGQETTSVDRFWHMDGLENDLVF